LSLLEVINVYKSFGGREVLKNICLDVRRGEILSVIGPSGSGKTTLLKLMNLLLYPDRGKIFFDGVDTAVDEKQRRLLRRGMGMVFQHPALFDTTVFNNIALGLRIRGLPKEEIERRVEDALNYVGLRGFAKRKASSLSAGEAQRISLARALVLEPKLLLLDEPTANLDPANVLQIEEAVRRVNSEKGVTVVIATHNLLQARRLSHRVAFLWMGELVEVRETREFFENPRSEKTALYLSGKIVY
jgi:tungstate transport system ATP-binding protein